MARLITIRLYMKRMALLLVLLTVLYLMSLNLETGYFGKYAIESSDIQFSYINPPVVLQSKIEETNKGATQSPLEASFNSRGRPNCLKEDIRSGYCQIPNYVSAKNVVRFNDSVTLTTQGTVTFLIHIREVCKRWKGPISLTVYAPGSDFELAGSHVRYLRNCGQDKCVRDWVTWHLVYDEKHRPTAIGDDWMASDCREPIQSNDSYVTRFKLAYPINVARNVARLNARTRYVFASDIELYPSLNIIPEFLKMVRDRGAKITKREVYVLPVFEVKNHVTSPPTNKRQLFDLYKSKQAVSFHRYVCDICHRIPGLEKWLFIKIGSNNWSLDVFKTTKRTKLNKLTGWEPFFISTNDFPYFDEELTWNGKSNKMQVALEMCLLDYDFHILDNAFLVHAPGIKIYSAAREKSRASFIIKNNKRKRIIHHELNQTYGHAMQQCV